jgi:hypothetical protein
MIDPELCQAIGIVLHESPAPVKTRIIALFVRSYVRTPAMVPDVDVHLHHLEARGDVRRHADPDNPTILSWSLTDAGKQRFQD